MGPSQAADLAAQLLAAWDQGPLVEPSDPVWDGIDQESASTVGAEVLARLGSGIEAAAWKLGATDPETQARLGVPGPIHAPLVPARVQRDVTSCTVERDAFRQPRLEAEIGLVLVDGAWVAVPAVEIADCRVTGWHLPPWSVLADACLQGAMLFGAVGPGGPTGDEVSVVVRHDGAEVSRGSGTVGAAVERLSVLPADARPTAVATGSLTPLHDLLPGRWDVDFGGFGRLVVDVT